MNALKRAGRRTPFLRIVLAIEVGHRVILQRNPRITFLLGAPMDQAVFTDVEIAGAGPTTPVVRFAFGDTVLKPIEARVVLVSHLLYLLEDVFFFW